MKFLEAIGAYRDHLLNHFTTIYPGCVEQEPLPKSASQNLLVSRGGAYCRLENRQGANRCRVLLGVLSHASAMQRGSLIARLTPRHISPDSACRNR